MGQAKRRGSFEERKRRAIIKADKMAKANRQAEYDRVNNMTPEERRQEINKQLAFATFAAFAYPTNPITRLLDMFGDVKKKPHHQKQKENK